MQVPGGRKAAGPLHDQDMTGMSIPKLALGRSEDPGEARRQKSLDRLRET
jgi:hypothetical protein